MNNITVLGAGAWGSALAGLLAKKGSAVTLWSALDSEANRLKATREVKNIKNFKLPENIKITRDIKEAVKDKNLVVFAVASIYVREVARIVAPHIDRSIPVVNVAKGIEEETLFTLTEVIEDEFKKNNGLEGDIAVMSGPSHAEEVILRMPTTVVVGAKTELTAKKIQDCFMTERFRVYTSPDIIGIELGGAIKNVIALAAGILDGLGYGDNSKAALITRGIAEISKLGLKMGGKLETFAGLSGIGDLIVTCCSNHSRNHNAGFLIGRGYTVMEAMQEVGQVVEGVNSAWAAKKLAIKNGVDLPIVEKINEILFEDKSPTDALSELLLRDKKMENSNLSWGN